MRALKLFLAAVILTLLINSCNDPFNSDLSPAGRLPAGKGSFSLKINGEGRTIVPLDKAFVREDLSYELIFTPTGANGKAETFERTYGDLVEPVVLDLGTYRLVVNAYDANNLLFSGTANTNIEIQKDVPAIAEVTLQPVITGGTGTFRWIITLPASVVSATMVITDRKTNAPAVDTITLSPSANAAAVTRNLPAGYYNVTVTINGTGDHDKKVIIRREILYIYNNRESVYGPIIFTDNQFTGASTVTLSGLLETEYITIEHGRNLNDYFAAVNFDIDPHKPSEDAYLYANAKLPANEADIGFSFGGWYYTDDDGEHEWETNDPVLDDMTLYPKWNGDFDDFGLAHIVMALNSGNYDASNSTLLIMENITLTNWNIPIGTGDYPFNGTCIGNGKIITFEDITLDDFFGETYGLFGHIGAGGVVENLNLEGNIDITSNIDSSCFFGALAGVNNGTINDVSSLVNISVTIDGVIDSSTDNFTVGGIVGKNNGTVDSCSNAGAVTAIGSATADGNTGGVVGWSRGIVQDCSAVGDVTVTNSYSDAGGVVGRNSGTVQDCSYAEGTVSGYLAGGVVGINSSYDRFPGTESIVKYCNSTGVVVGNSNAGGVVGYNSPDDDDNDPDGIKVQNCYATGDVSTTENGGQVGGVVSYNRFGIVENCYYAIGTLTAKAIIGGVVGYNSQGTVQNCYATVDVTATGNTPYAGGVVGYNWGANDLSTVQYCYATGNVTASGSTNSNYYAGGVVGWNKGTYGKVMNCVTLSESIICESRTPGSEAYAIAGRVVGASDSAAGLSDNYAWSDMTVNGSVPIADIGDIEKNGGNWDTIDVKNQTSWSNAGFSFNDPSPWVFYGNSYMPSLEEVGEPSLWPGHLD